MNVHEELIQRCAARRRKALGDLSDQGFAELLLAVRENPSAFVDSPAEEAYVELERAFSAYDASLNNDDLLEDDEYQKARQKRLANLQAGCARALSLDEKCLDAQLVGTLAADLDPDSLLEQLLSLHDGTDAASNAPEGCDLWADVFSRPKLRLEAAIGRTLLDGARHRLAAQACERVIAVAPTDELGCRHTEAIALARLEDEEGFDQLDARFGRHDNAWTSLSRCVLMYKLGRMSAARRALAGFDRLCQGGSYALMRPVFVEVYLPDRPPVAVNSLEEATLAVHEMEPTIADVPDFINWAAAQPGISASAEAFAQRNDLDW